MATSLPWQASSAAYSSAWSQQASSSSVSAGGGYSACPAGAFPRALELTPSSATWPLGPPAQMPAIASISCRRRRRLFRHRNSSGGCTPPRPSLHPPPQHLLPLAPLWAATPPTTCASSWPGADRDCSSTWSALAKHSPGTTSSAYQWPPSPPQFGHLQFGSLSGHGMNWEAVGCGTTVTGQVCILTFTCGQERS